MSKKVKESGSKPPQIEKKVKEPKAKPQVEKKVKEPKAKPQVEKKVKEPKVKPQVEKKVEEPKAKPQIEKKIKEPESKPQIINKKKIVGHETMTNRWGYVFVAPFVIVFCVFNLWPTVYTFLLSFTDLAGFKTVFTFIGPNNFVRLIHDAYFWGALGNTFIIWTINFIPQLGLALLLSIWLSDVRLNLAGKGLFRAIVYMPNLLTAVSVALLFRSVFGYNAHVTAPANQFLRSLGIQDTIILNGEAVKEAYNFFRSVAFSRGLVAFIQWWMWYGYTMIILMAGITTISPSLYESAVIDGANSRQTTWYITLPLLRPIMLYILVTSAIGGMQMFDIPFLLTDMLGAPDFKIRTTTVYQYNIAFSRGANDYAYAAAISIGIFFVTIVLALLIFFFLQDRSELKKQKGGK
ncbi:MAG: ABC transporter permease subunit [Treponema sp.]|nr:ABC transporter permease subunit [Treponema sp.]